MLIKNARFIVTQNKRREILEGKDIFIKDNVISNIGKNLSKTDEVIDGRNKIIIPGLINTHTHTPMALFRGVSDDKDLHEWLSERIVPLEKKMDKEKVYYGSLLAILEKISTGTTTFNEMYSYIDTIIKAVNKSGIRAFLAPGLKDNNEKENIDNEIKKASETVKKIRKSKSLIKPAFSLHWTLTCSDELIKRVHEINKEKLPVHMHISETKREVEENIKRFGLRPFERLEKLGILSDNFIGLHCVHLSKKEIELISKNNCKVVHNPSANMKLADGVCPVYDLLQNGVCVSLGTDSPASNDNLNMFEEMKLTSLLQKVYYKNASVLNAQKTFDLATTNAAKTLGMENQIGSIEIGKKADLVFIDKNEITMNPIHGKTGLISNLVFSFDGRVCDVMVDGKFLLRDYEFLTLDKDEIVNKVRELVQNDFLTEE
ncbi:MAG: amidohydrolase [Candidatus Heimdallarchaeaceae archaeon]